MFRFISLFFSICTFFSLQGEPIYFFTPPKDWACAKPDHLSLHVEVGFIGASSGGFHPSLNLAKEQIDVDLKDYIKAVKKIHSSQPDTRFRDLGEFQMQAGKGRLIEIQTASSWGAVKMLQAIFVQGGTAFILTSATLKEDFSKWQKEILASLRSFNVAEDLFAPIADVKRREQLKTLFSSLPIKEAITQDNRKQLQNEKWQALQNEVADLQTELGSHWLFLFLREGHRQIYTQMN